MDLIPRLAIRWTHWFKKITSLSEQCVSQRHLLMIWRHQEMKMDLIFFSQWLITFAITNWCMISYLASFLAMVLSISVFVKEPFSSFYFFPLKVFRLQSCHSQPDLSKAKLLELLNFFTLTHFLQLSKSIFMTFYFTFFCFLMSFSKFGPLNCWQHTNSPPTSAAYMSRDCNSSFSYKTVQGACTEVFICYRFKSCLGGTPFLLYGWHTLFLSAILCCAWIYSNIFCLSKPKSSGDCFPPVFVWGEDLINFLIFIPIN